MPVIREVPTDPTDVLIQAELFRSEAFRTPVGAVALPPLVAGDCLAPQASVGVVVAGAQEYLTMQADFAYSVGSNLSANSYGSWMARNNGAIATPCGALVPLEPSKASCMQRRFVQGTELWRISVTTQDSGGTAIAGARVMALEVGQLYEGGQPLQVEGITDGSGVVALDVPTNTDYLLVAYKSGSPDVSGVSVQTVGPTQV